jgi:hypothetical protein
MERETYDNASRRHTFIVVLVIDVLAFLVLISIAGATRNSIAWYNKAVNLNKLKKIDL